MIIDLVASDDQRAIAEGVRDFLRDQLPVARLREETAFGAASERAKWDDLAGLGLFGLGLPEEQGGLGLGLAEEALVAKALGEYLVSPAVLAQMAAPHAACDEVLAGALAAGEERAALAGPAGDGLLLLDGEGASQVLVIAPGGVALVARDILGEGCATECIDQSVAMVRIPSVDLPNEWTPVASRIVILISAYMAGLAQAATDMAVEYAKVREQFGQPIGAFQAIKHQCADMASRAAAADAQAMHAAVAFGQGMDDASEAAAARLLAKEASVANGKANIQIHGGMGFTAECDAHIYLKRAHLLSALGNDRAVARRQVLGLD